MADHILSKGFKVTTGKAYQRGMVMQLTAFQTVDIATAGTQNIIGVCMEDLDQVKADTGKAAVGVDIMGVSRCIASAAIAVGARVTATTGGKIVTMTPAAAFPTARCLGIAMQAATANNDEIDVLLTPGAQF
jgi:hypothetical protein